MIDAPTAARYLLFLLQDVCPGMTVVTLCALLYFAQGLHMLRFRAPLFDETFAALAHGPALQSVFRAFAVYGTDPIPVSKDTPDAFSSLPNDAESVLFDTARMFGARSEDELCHLACAPGTPWYAVVHPDDADGAGAGAGDAGGTNAAASAVGEAGYRTSSAAAPGCPEQPSLPTGDPGSSRGLAGQAQPMTTQQDAPALQTHFTAISRTIPTSLLMEYFPAHPLIFSEPPVRQYAAEDIINTRDDDGFLVLPHDWYSEEDDFEAEGTDFAV